VDNSVTRLGSGPKLREWKCSGAAFDVLAFGWILVTRDGESCGGGLGISCLMVGVRSLVKTTELAVSVDTRFA